MKLATIHHTLRDVRKERNITQEEMGDILNIEQAAVSMYEKGKRGIPYELLDQWLEVLGIDVIITPKGYEPIKPIEDTKSDLETFNDLKTRRNYLIAELRTFMAEKVINSTPVVHSDGDKIFTIYSLYTNHRVELLETRYDHPTQKQIAVEYTEEEVNVYKFITFDNGEAGVFSDKVNLNVNHNYFTEADFVELNGEWDCENFERRKETIMRVNPAHPEGYELLTSEGFSIRALLEMQNNHKDFSIVCEEIHHYEEYREMQDELFDIQDRIYSLLEENRLANHRYNPDFNTWTKEDDAAIAIPLNETSRSWMWIKPGLAWTRDVHIDYGFSD